MEMASTSEKPQDMEPRLAKSAWRTGISAEATSCRSDQLKSFSSLSSKSSSCGGAGSLTNHFHTILMRPVIVATRCFIATDQPKPDSEEDTNRCDPSRCIRTWLMVHLWSNWSSVNNTAPHSLQSRLVISMIRNALGESALAAIQGLKAKPTHVMLVMFP